MLLSLQALGNKQEEQSMKARLEKLEQENRLAAQVAHDIRSPLTALKRPGG